MRFDEPVEDVISRFLKVLLVERVYCLTCREKKSVVVEEEEEKT